MNIQSRWRAIHPHWLICTGLFYAFAAGSTPACSAAPPTVKVGVARVDVTPRTPVVLAGYGGRTTEHEGIDTPLWARAMVIGDTDPVAIVVLDNCGITDALRNQLATRLASRGIPKSHLVVAATHTHNAPSLEGYAAIVWAGRTNELQDAHVRQYTAYALDQMESAVMQAHASRIPMSLSWMRGRVTFGGNRRVLRQGNWAGFGFQRSGPVDHSLPVLVARDLQGKVRGVWANYACHCTTVGARNRVGGDWAGFANREIEAAFPQAVSLMTIGCGADVGPQPSGSLQVAEQHGQSIAQEVRRLLMDPGQPLTGPPQVTERRIALPLAKPQTPEYWEQQLGSGGFQGALARAVVEKIKQTGAVPSTVDYPLAMWKFDDDLAVVFLAGEVVVDYAVRLNRELDWRRLWITAWANAMPGYIPSRRILEEGGYEADFSQIYYAQPSRYAPTVEDQLVREVVDMAGPSFLPAKDQPPAPFHTLPSNEALTKKRLAAWAQAEKPPAEQAIFERVLQLIGTSQPAFDGKTVQGGEDTEWHNYSGDFGPRQFIRQTQAGHEIRWKTPATAKQNGPLTLCFLGGLGWESEPQTEGFGLSIDGQETIRFDVTRQATRWSTPDGTVELLYLPTWKSDVDSAGYFFLTLPAARRSADQPIALAVRSLSGNSKRWFAIDLEPKLAAKIKLLRDLLKNN